MMNKDNLVHIYLMPGMAASSRIFEHIKLPTDSYELHYLDWIIPNPQESLVQYAQRMCARIKHQEPVLLGVSFGGVLVQEMSKLMPVHKLFVVSSIKSKHELPKRLKFLRKGRLYRFLPTSIVKKIDFLASLSVGERLSKRLELYQKYLYVNDPSYLDWAIKELIYWEQDEPLQEAIYIHGDKDVIFPHSCSGNCIVVENGTHVMVVNRFRWFNENLPKLIEGTFNI